MAFCNPQDLCYHNFEHVVPLDGPFAEMPPVQAKIVTSIDACEIGKSKVFSFSLAGNCDALLTLKRWESFLPPVNEDQRGGHRLIFRSPTLASRLTEALRHQHRNLPDFDFVNEVFRLNKFQPTDAQFDSHYDLPYVDNIHSRRSRYTLLLYLSGGKGDPGVIRIGEYMVPQVEELQCILFHQSMEHEGWPFVEGDKLFLRTELVVTV